MARPKTLHRYRFTTPLDKHCPMVNTPMALWRQALESGLMKDMNIHEHNAILLGYGEMFNQACKESLPPKDAPQPPPADEDYIWIHRDTDLTWVGNACRLLHYFEEAAYAYKTHPENKGKRSNGGWNYTEADCQKALDWMIRNKWVTREEY